MSFGQNVNIPDANFKNYLVNNSAINTNGDSEIQVSEASSFTGTINCSSQNISGLTISDLTGIEAFTALTDLRCAYNQLTSLDVSSNTALTFFNCGYNQLTSLNVSSNTALTELYCGENNISSLDVSSNTALTNLNCGYNQLTSLDVFNNTALTLFTCPNNQLTSLDVSSNTALTQFTCHQNYLTSLDVTNNTALTDLFCHWNQLECLNVKNGNNTDISNFFAYNNPSLTCIEVDDVNYSNNNWTSNNNMNYIDPQTSFSTDCGNDCAACIPTSSIDFHTACDSYTWIDGNTYTASTNNPNPTVHTINAGSYYYLPSTLTINAGDVVEWINDGGFHDVNGETNTITGLPYNNPEVFNSPSTSVVGAVIYSHTFTIPGTYEYDCSVGQHAANGMTGILTVLSPPTYTIPNVAGCDSVITLDLTINYSNTGTDVITACDSYTWLDGNTYTSSNNIATYTTINAAGCDSVITLDLTINPQSTSSIIKTACSFYTAPDDEVYTSTGNYTAIIDNAAGCDSVITIDLTINPTPSAAVTQNGATLTATQTGATYQWIDCDDESNIVGEINQAFTPAVTGSYAVIVTIGDCFKKSDCFLVDFTGIGELNNTPKQLIKIVDVARQRNTI